MVDLNKLCREIRTNWDTCKTAFDMAGDFVALAGAFECRGKEIEKLKRELDDSKEAIRILSHRDEPEVSDFAIEVGQTRAELMAEIERLVSLSTELEGRCQSYSEMLHDKDIEIGGLRMQLQESAKVMESLANNVQKFADNAQSKSDEMKLKPDRDWLLSIGFRFDGLKPPYLVLETDVVGLRVYNVEYAIEQWSFYPTGYSQFHILPTRPETRRDALELLQLLGFKDAIKNSEPPQSPQPPVPGTVVSDESGRPVGVVMDDLKSNAISVDFSSIQESSKKITESETFVKAVHPSAECVKAGVKKYAVRISMTDGSYGHFPPKDTPEESWSCAKRAIEVFTAEVLRNSEKTEEKKEEMK